MDGEEPGSIETGEPTRVVSRHWLSSRGVDFIRTLLEMIGELIVGSAARCVKLAVRHKLPVNGVALIIGNDLAGGKVLPVPEVIKNPVYDSVTSGELASEFPSVFAACVVTRAQTRKFGDSIGISDTFLAVEDQKIIMLVGLLHPLSKTISFSTAMNSTRQDLDAIHTEHDIVHDEGFLESTAEGIKA
ncbi:hypothetical protein F2P79_025260 [Pimephales promelas]|nr:hypothetical protein F2P79_025260 [Pimephales promelas]